MDRTKLMLRTIATIAALTPYRCSASSVSLPPSSVKRVYWNTPSLNANRIICRETTYKSYSLSNMTMDSGDRLGKLPDRPSDCPNSKDLPSGDDMYFHLLTTGPAHSLPNEHRQPASRRTERYARTVACIGRHGGTHPGCRPHPAYVYGVVSINVIGNQQ